MMNKLTSFDTSNDLYVQRQGNGIRLVRPEHTKQGQLHLTTMAQLQELPCHIFFLNTDSVIIKINETATKNCGFTSVNDAIGRTIDAVAKPDTANMIQSYDRLAMTSNCTLVNDVAYERSHDDNHFQFLSVRFPWYGDNNKIIGVLGCSIVISTCPQAFANAFSLLMQTGLLAASHTPTSTKSFLSIPTIGFVNVTPREKDVLEQLSLGKTNKAIGEKLGIKQRTVDEYIANLKRKLNTNSRSDLIEKAINFI